MAAPRASVVLSTGGGERGAGWLREGDRGRVRRAAPSSRCRGCCSGAGGDLREAAGLRRVLPGPRLPTGRRSGARLAVAGRSRQRGLPPGVPGLRLQARARPPSRAGAAPPAGRNADSEISDVFLLLSFTGSCQSLYGRGPGTGVATRQGFRPRGWKDAQGSGACR